jgi:hypothetical protein
MISPIPIHEKMLVKFLIRDEEKIFSLFNSLMTQKNRAHRSSPTRSLGEALLRSQKRAAFCNCNLVGGFNPSEKYEFVSGDDDIPN